MRAPLLAGLALAASALWAGQPLEIQLDWKFNAQFAGLIVAAEKGYFAAEGLDVTVRDLGALPYDQLGAKVATTPGVVGSIEAGLLLSNRAAGHDLVAIGTMFQASPLGLISLETSGIRTPADLKGRKILIHADGREALAALLRQQGLSHGDVQAEEGGYGMADLLAGECEVKQGYLVDELVRLRLDGHPARAFAYRDYGYVAYSQVYTVSRKTLETRREDLVRLLRAAARGWAEASRDPRAAAELIHATRSPQLDVPYLEASLREIVPLLTAETPALGAMKAESWASQRAHFLELYPTSTVGAVSDFVDDLAPRP